MASKLRARWRRFWHCLWHLHRMDTITVADHAFGWRTVYIGCECGKIFWCEDGIIAKE